MGGGGVPDAQFQVAGRETFDWVPRAAIAHVASPHRDAALCDDNATCSNGGTFALRRRRHRRARGGRARRAQDLHEHRERVLLRRVPLAHRRAQGRRVHLLQPDLEDVGFDGHVRPDAGEGRAAERGGRLGGPLGRRAERRRDARARPRRRRRRRHGGRGRRRGADRVRELRRAALGATKRRWASMASSTSAATATVRAPP